MLHENNTRTKKALITINNPHKYEFSRSELIRLILTKFTIVYFCLSYEKGSTEHVHIFILFKNYTRFSTIQNTFNNIAHIDVVRSTCQQNRDYIAKMGKWENTKKAETSIKDTFFEYGDMPSEAEEQAITKALLIKLISEGKSDFEILKDYPQFAYQLKNIELIRETFLTNKYRTELRDLDVIYLFSESNSEKLKYIYAKHNATEICRITNYAKGKIQFDNYHAHKVLVFDNFCSDINITTLCNYLSGYPLNLSARYNDRVACYTTIYILSNSPLEMQYYDTQNKNPKLWNIFIENLNQIIELRSDGSTKRYEKERYHIYEEQ